MRRAILVVPAALAACRLAGAPELDPTEHVRGEHRRLVPGVQEALWPALLAALEGDVGVARADPAQGTIVTRAVRQAARDAPRRFAEIADVSAARRAGLRGVSELVVTYYLLLAPALDGGTSLTIRSAIEAVDRRTTLLGSDLFGVLPTRVPVPSRGVLERELMRRLAADLFATEEVLLLLGEPGTD